MFVVLIGLILVLLVIYVKIKYFTLRGPIPGLAPRLFVGNMMELGMLFGDVTLWQALAKLKEKFGDVFQFWVGPSRFVAVNNINDVQYIYNHRQIYDHADILGNKVRVLFPDSMGTSRGSQYKRHALVVMPIFRRAKIIPQIDTIIECTDKLLNNWRNQNDGQIHTDIVNQCQKLLLNIFGLIAFDYDLHTLDDITDQTSSQLKTALEDILMAFRILVFSPRFVSILYKYFSFRHRRSQKFLEEYVNRIVEQELNNDPSLVLQRKKTCLIASLVASLQEDEQAEAMKAEEEKRGLTRNEVLNEVLGFLVAGYETTSSALAWLIHLLSKNPRVQKKIKEELSQTGANHQLTIEQLDFMVYLDCVVKEVLRFRPPTEGSVRTLTADDRLPESDFQLYKDDSVFIPYYNLAHDTRYWNIDPQIFYPERFEGDDKNHHPLANIPFGSGHRQCVGRDLAQLELKVIGARLMQLVTFGDGGDQVNSGGCIMGLTIMPKHVGVTINFD